jgi:hypothetical protein
VAAPELRSRTALEGFDFRKSRGNGIFLTRKQIEAKGTHQLTNVLRGERGLEVVPNRQGRSVLRFAQYRGKNCEPQVWVDGRVARGLEIDDLPASDIEAIELYDGPSSTPGEFVRGPIISCGTIVIWTRIPLLQRSPQD